MGVRIRIESDEPGVARSYAALLRTLLGIRRCDVMTLCDGKPSSAGNVQPGNIGGREVRIDYAGHAAAEA